MARELKGRLTARGAEIGSVNKCGLCNDRLLQDNPQNSVPFGRTGRLLPQSSAHLVNVTRQCIRRHLLLSIVRWKYLKKRYHMSKMKGDYTRSAEIGNRPLAKCYGWSRIEVI